MEGQGTGGAAHPPSGLMQGGSAQQVHDGGGGSRGTPKGHVWCGRRQGLPFFQADRFQEHSLTARSLSGPCAPSPPSTAPAPAPPRASVFASSRYAPICRRAEEVV